MDYLSTTCFERTTSSVFGKKIGEEVRAEWSLWPDIALCDDEDEGDDKRYSASKKVGEDG